jgi:photosystem II stability/assembly factor-like uncharacterized protein
MRNKITILLPIILLCAGCNIFSSSPVGGVSKSLNGGTDWQFSNGIKKDNSVNLTVLNVSKMAISPENHETVYASGYNGGLYKSKDSGGTWTKILSKISVYDFVIDSSDSKVIYACGQYNGFGKALKSKDGGASWQEIYNDPTANNVVRSMAINPSNASQIFIGTDTGEFIKSADGGLSWQLAKNFKDRIQRVKWQNSGAYALLRSGGLYFTNDFGENFKNLSQNLMENFHLSIINYNSGSDQYFNQFYVDEITSSLIYITTGKGLYKTTDFGQTWINVSLPINSGSANARAIDVAKSSSNLVYTAIGSTIYKSTDGGKNWQTKSIATNGFINYILIDQQLPQIVYAGAYVAQQ